MYVEAIRKRRWLMLAGRFKKLMPRLSSGGVSGFLKLAMYVLAVMTGEGWGSGRCMRGWGSCIGSNGQRRCRGMFVGLRWCVV